jgi:hypothetical protein
MTTPPSFDQFYNSQGDVNMPSQQSSFDQYTATAFASASGAEHQFGAIYAQQLGDEPASLGVDESAHTLNHRSSHEGLRPHFGMGDPRANVERKDSVPFDPTSSSTLIASASNTPSKPFLHQHQQHQHQQHQQHQHQQQRLFNKKQRRQQQLLQQKNGLLNANQAVLIQLRTVNTSDVTNYLLHI